MKNLLKKYSFLLLTILLLVIFKNKLYCAGSFTHGSKLGINNSIFIGSDIPGKGVSKIPGFTFGYFFAYDLNNCLTVQQELFLISKGSNINTVGEVNLTNVFIYGEYPLLIRYNFDYKGKMNPFIMGGPSFSKKILVINGIGMPDNIRNYDIGLNAGAGISVFNFILEIRLSRGLLNFDISDDNIHLKNQTLSFFVNYSLNK